MTKTNKSTKAVKNTEEKLPIIPATNGVGLASAAEINAALNAPVSEVAADKAAQVELDIQAEDVVLAADHIAEQEAYIQSEVITMDHVEALAINAQFDVDQQNLAAAVKAEDGTNSQDAMALEVAAIMNNTEMAPEAKWAMISKLAASKIDETIITDLSLLTDTEIMRRLRLLWSKRVAAKKVNDLIALEDIAAQEAELQSHRTAKSSRRGNTVSADSDPTTLSQENLNKLIRNVQSKKCTAKKLGNQADVDMYQAEEDKLKALRVEGPAVPKGPSAMSLKILATIEALRALPQSDVVDAQIKMLETLA